MSSNQKIRTPLIVAFAVAALFAPTALADRISEHSAGQNAVAELRVPLDPAIAAAIQNHRTVTPERISERSLGQNATRTAASSAVQESIPSSGFDWGDAGIGASVALATVLLLGATALVPRRRRRLAGI